MSDVESIRLLLQQASAKGSRSTALNPLAWALGMLLFSLSGSEFVRAPAWFAILLGASIGVIVIAYLVAYFFLLAKNPDALRSEKFTLSKMAIERSVAGDNLAGFLNFKDDADLPPVADARKALE